MSQDKKIKKLIKRMILFFMVMLFLSGLTALPIERELNALLNILPAQTSLYYWLHKVEEGYSATRLKYPFLLYGYDWLAFAHFILALLFIGPYRDPVRNIWVLRFGLLACLLVFPMALISGPFRGIPLGWQLIDCSFGVFGFLPLWFCYVKTKELENISENQNNQ